MKPVTRTIFLMLAAAALVACEQEISQEQSERFIKFFGNHLLDEARDMEVLDDGDIAICGVDSVQGEGKRMVLIRTDPFGNLRPGFPMYYSEDGLQSGANALVLKRGGQGGFLLCGYVEKPAGGDTLQTDLFLVRTSAEGDTLWTKSFGSPGNESILHATEQISSGFILAGYQEQEGRRNFLVMGVTEEGDSIDLSLNINNPLVDNAAAEFILNTGEGYLCVATYSRTNNPGTDILVLNIDSDLSWTARVLGGNLDEFARCIIEDQEEQYLVLGKRFSASGRSEILIHLIETDGLLITNSLLLATISGRDADLYPERFVKMPDGRFAIVGTSVASGGEKSMFLQFLLPDYQVGERLTFGSAGSQTGADITLPDEGGILLTGSNGHGPNSMISLVRTGDSGEL